MIPTLASSVPLPRSMMPVAPSGTQAPSLPASTLSATAASDGDVGTLARIDPAPVITPAIPAIDDASLECVAKVVRHEAANQPERGQLAVAQLIVARTAAGSRFGNTACAVVNQPGQFFATDAYHPSRDSAEWKRAVAVSRDALGHVSPDVAPGALFYHAAYQAPPRFFRSRQRVMTLGDHIFYR